MLKPTSQQFALQTNSEASCVDSSLHTESRGLADTYERHLVGVTRGLVVLRMQKKIGFLQRTKVRIRCYRKLGILALCVHFGRWWPSERSRDHDARNLQLIYHAGKEQFEIFTDVNKEQR